MYEVASVTPITEAINLSKKTGNKVCLKREDLQPIFSFKNRGSYNKIKHLNNTEKEKGVIAASAGNHAQGVASACQKLKIKCLIVMPETTPEIKIKAVKSFKSQFYNENEPVHNTPISTKNFLDSIEYRARDLGLLTNVDYAEGFISARLPLIDSITVLK